MLPMVTTGGDAREATTALLLSTCEMLQLPTKEQHQPPHTASLAGQYIQLKWCVHTDTYTHKYVRQYRPSSLLARRPSSTPDPVHGGLSQRTTAELPSS